MNSKVSTSINIVWTIPVALHDFLGMIPPAPAPVPVKSPASFGLEIPVTMMWPPGMKVGKNKLTTTVFHNDRRMALDGHDCGVLIPHYHLVPTPANLLLAIFILFSSRKAMFSASTVMMNKAPTACIKLPLLPMITCEQPVSLPFAFAINDMNTVTVGMTAGDLAAGWIAIGLSIALDVLLWSLKGPIGGQIKKAMAAAGHDALEAAAKKGAAALEQAAFDELKKGMLGKLLGGKTMEEWGLKQVVGFATGVAKLALTGQGGPSAGVGSPYAELKTQSSVGAAGSSSKTTVGGVGQQTDWSSTPGGPSKTQTTDRGWTQLTPVSKAGPHGGSGGAGGAAGTGGAGGGKP